MNKDNNPKLKQIIKKIVIILSIIISIIGVIAAFFCFIQAFTIESIEFFGPLLNILMFFGGFVFLIYAGILIGFLWLFYGVFLLLYNFYNKIDSKNKKKFIIILLSLLVVTFSILVISDIYNDRNKEIEEVLLEPPSYDFYDKSSYYFINDNHIYYYVYDYNLVTSKTYDRLYVMNLDGSNNRLLAEGDELRYADFYFVYNNEAYYYTMYYAENMKVNLSTGQITRLDNDDNYISKTLKDGVVNAFYDNAVVGNSYASFKKIDLNTNKIIYDNTTSHTLVDNEFFLDYDSGNIYYLDDYYSEYPTIYKNNDVLYEFKDSKKINLMFLAVDTDYLYYVFENTIYRLDISSGVTETLSFCTYKLDEIKRISSGNNKDNYFHINGIIYEFDLKDARFKVLIRDVDAAPEYVYNFEDKLIFTENTDNCRHLSDINNTGTVIIYDVSSRYAKHVDNIIKTSFDSKYLYMLIGNGSDYYIDKYALY